MLHDKDNINYYKTNGFLRFLRFLNLLEPDRNIISISKIFMWISISLVFFAFMFVPDNLEVMVAAIGGLFATFSNYSYRRWAMMQYPNDRRPRRFQEDEDEDFEPPAYVAPGRKNREEVAAPTDEYDIDPKSNT